MKGGCVSSVKVCGCRQLSSAVQCRKGCQRHAVRLMKAQKITEILSIATDLLSPTARVKSLECNPATQVLET